MPQGLELAASDTIQGLQVAAVASGICRGPCGSISLGTADDCDCWSEMSPPATPQPCLVEGFGPIVFIPCALAVLRGGGEQPRGPTEHQ